MDSPELVAEVVKLCRHRIRPLPVGHLVIKKGLVVFVFIKVFGGHTPPKHGSMVDRERGFVGTLVGLDHKVKLIAQDTEGKIFMCPDVPAFQPLDYVELESLKRAVESL